MYNNIIEIMKEINQSIKNMESQEQYLNEEQRKLWNAQKLGYQKSLEIVAKYLSK